MPGINTVSVKVDQMIVGAVDAIEQRVIGGTFQAFQGQSASGGQGLQSIPHSQALALAWQRGQVPRSRFDEKEPGW